MGKRMTVGQGLQILREREDVLMHASDCAVHNGPALPEGPCDCGAEQQTPAAQSTATRLAEIAERLAKATPGPLDVGVMDPERGAGEWFLAMLAGSDSKVVNMVWAPQHPNTRGSYPRPEHAIITAVTGNGPQSEANADFYAAAPTDITWLLRKCKAQQKALEAAHHELTMHDGLIATDRPDRIKAEGPVTWKLDSQDVLRQIDAALMGKVNRG